MSLRKITLPVRAAEESEVTTRGASPGGMREAYYGSEAVRFMAQVAERTREHPEEAATLAAESRVMHELHVALGTMPDGSAGVRVLSDAEARAKYAEWGEPFPGEDEVVTGHGAFQIPARALPQTVLFADVPSEVRQPYRDAEDEIPEPEPELAQTAYARTEDPWTSHAAARSLTVEALRETQAAVLDCLRRYGSMNHEELCKVYEHTRVAHTWPQQSVSGLRTRTKELVDGGLVRNSGRTVMLPTNRSSIVWEVAE